VTTGSNSTRFDLSGRVALITGGGKGLGRVMAVGLARAKADVVVVGRGEEDLKSVVAEIVDGARTKAFYIRADLEQRDEVERVAEEATQRAGAVDILINNAGANTLQRIEDVTDDAWDRIVQLNLTAAMALTRALAPQMCARRWGRILHIASISPFRPLEGRDAYAAAKAGLGGLTRASAVDLGPSGVTVNSIAPGFFPTDLTRRLVSESVRREYVERAALRRVGDPDELVGPILLFVSDAGSYITGQTLIVDGGWLLG
jgi:NAD(P)-dependent dehydrogenase (short-subunit alcohol dehydrogenase family)